MSRLIARANSGMPSSSRVRSVRAFQMVSTVHADALAVGRVCGAPAVDGVGATRISASVERRPLVASMGEAAHAAAQAAMKHVAERRNDIPMGHVTAES